MELKPCPFCGKEAIDYSGYGKDKVGCDNSSCCLYCSAVDREVWNNRPADPRVSELEVERDELRAIKNHAKHQCRLALLDKFFEKTVKDIYRAIQKYELSSTARRRRNG